MNLRAFAFLALLASPAWARIVVDDSEPEPAPENAGVNVPSPAGAGAGAQTAIPQALDTLSFLNKDQLHGLLLGIDQSSGLRWQSPEARDPIVFKTGQLSEVKLDSHKASSLGRSAQLIDLTNGDQFPGNIVSLDDKILALDTWYAGRLTFPRAMIRRITPLADNGAAIYEGPDGLDGWSLGRMAGGRSWEFRDGAFIGSSYGTIGRDVGLPDMSKVEFDLVLRGNQFAVGIYSDRADNFGNCYMLQLSPGYTELQRYSRSNGSNDLGSVQLQNAIRGDSSHIELRSDRTRKSIWLLIDGKIIKQWTDPADFNGLGGNILFSCQQGTFVKISNIKISKWDGKFEDMDDSADKSDNDAIQLANDDKVSGHLDSIHDGNAKLSSSYAELNIPLDRVGQIDFAGAHSSQAGETPSDVRAYFPDGGCVTMQLLQWDDKGCAGSSPNFGKAIFSPDAFARIVFNLPAQKAAAEAESDDDSGQTDSEGD
jgi:hypothetical protein